MSGDQNGKGGGARKQICYTSIYSEDWNSTNWFCCTRIAVAYIGLLNNDYVANIRAIGFQDAIVLIGLGLGIGSLKEIFDK